MSAREDDAALADDVLADRITNARQEIERLTRQLDRYEREAARRGVVIGIATKRYRALVCGGETWPV